MRRIIVKKLLQNQGWLSNVSISLNDEGIIQSIDKNSNLDGEIAIDGYAIPGFQNAHSHAFQYAMAGLGERHSGKNGVDDFWAWRETMYQLALSINPDQLKIIAEMLYRELLRHGYTQVAEFHYVHHDQKGKPYNNLAAMGEALVEAAKAVGIKITLIPIFYQMGNFGTFPNDRQRRFISKTIDEYCDLLESSKKICLDYEGANVGVGIHSMRAVQHEEILRVANEFSKELPFHIHVAEQLKEVEGCKNYLGKRPVEWLLDNLALNNRFNIVHATHLTKNETNRLAQSGANVVLCPSTEGNLGDGLFPLKNYQEHGGNWSIGTDSHIGLNPFEELRLLDYGQRLVTHKRDTFIRNEESDSGFSALTSITKAGRKAMNNASESFFEVGKPFDACIIDANAPLLKGTSDKHLASSIVYTCDSSKILGTFVDGNWIKSDRNDQGIIDRFVHTIKSII